MSAPLASNAMHNRNQVPSGTGQSSNRGSSSAGKNVKRKSSKPIIMWLQRKLAGTVRPRRVSDSDKRAVGVAVAATAGSGARGQGQATGRTTSFKNGVAARPHANTYSGNVNTSARDIDENGYALRGLGAYRPVSNEISLNSTDGDSFSEENDNDMESTRRSSGAAVSMWGSRSNPVEADEDASIRPLPPTSPPSPSPSRSSSSYLSDPRTFKSMTASTKPTTLLSIDITPNGMAHIAQAPPTPTSVTFERNTGSPSPVARFPHVRQPSNGPSVVGATAITFSALPPSPQSSRPSSLNPLRAAALQAPQHTPHHPRNNPRPSSPPRDDASMFTLASSAFGIPSGPTRWAGAADSMSHLGGGDSQSHFVLDTDAFCGDDMRDSSVRALRPRSERRNSWESEASRWSAGASLTLGAGLGGLGRDRSLRTAPSFRTGGQGTVDDGASVSILGGDEDLASTREADIEEQATEDETDSALERAFSPMSAMSLEGEDGMSADAYKNAHSTGLRLREKDVVEVEGESDFEDVATPGPAGRTIPLTEPPALPHSESMTSADSGSTTNISEPQTTPKKERSLIAVNGDAVKGKEKEVIGAAI